MERDNMLAHYFVLFWNLGLLLGYLAASSAKSGDIFLLYDPDFVQRWQNCMPILLILRDMTRDRQMTNRPKP